MRDPAGSPGAARTVSLSCERAAKPVATNVYLGAAVKGVPQTTEMKTMAGITAAQVKALREETGMPMMECKTALTDANGNTEEAKNLLQKKFKGKMASRAANVTGEGRVGLCIAEDRKTGAIVDLRCETAPVAKTDQFIALSDGIATSVRAQNNAEPSADETLALASSMTGGRTIGDEITEVFGLLRENIKLHGARRMTGEYLCGYVHHDGKSGVLIVLDATPTDAQVGVDLCHHVVFSDPMAITRASIPADQIEEIEKLAREMAEGEGKPAAIVDKIAQGKVNAFCAEHALMEQEHVKVSKTKVGDVLKQAGVGAVVDLCSFKIG